MPLSRTRSLFRSLSASNANVHTNSSTTGNQHKGSTGNSTKSTTVEEDDQGGHHGGNSLVSNLGFTLPTLSTLASITTRRRGRAKSTGKGKSDSNLDGWKGRDRARSKDQRRSQLDLSSADGQSEDAARSPGPPGDLGDGWARQANGCKHQPGSAPATPTTPRTASPPPPPTPTPATEPTSFSAKSSRPDTPISTTPAPAKTASINSAAVSASAAGAGVYIDSPSLDPPFSSHPPSPVTTNPPLVLVQRPSTPNVPSLPPAQPCPRYDPHGAMQRKLWVRRPGASPTRVEIAEDDLVDNVRDVILHKYANSLGRSIDAPDITLKIISREQGNKNVPLERALGPEEPIGATLDSYYPGGQTVDEALVIEVASARRTPRPSPRGGNHQISYYYQDQYRPPDDAREYFPPMPLHSPHLSTVAHPSAVQHSMSVLTTGQLPPLPSPGSHGRRHGRPKYGRQHTSSPTILHTVQPNGQVIESKSQMNGTIPTAPPLPTPPAPGDHKQSITPPNRGSSPHPGQKQKQKQRRNLVRNRSSNGDPSSSSKPASAALLDGTVPPINVLLVEDNVINLKLLEAFMKRLKVRWQSAMNGKEAVAMWRKGGFHLVLMDIQLPVMNGLDATKEIRRLEAVNGIGVFGGSPIDDHSKITSFTGTPAEADVLPDRSLFKSPVIIVALTASSLQSDRHEALAAGCNDFLTKPVNFVWMERKVTEWGCMQALIDFDGWRKWKQYAEEKAKEDPVKKAAEAKEEKAKAKAALTAMFSRPPPSVKKDSADSTGSSSTNTVNRSTTPSQNGTAAKRVSSPSTTGPPRGHRSSRSTSNGGRGSLESMAEENGVGS
ncbi:Two-component response regulator SSK1p [Rhinocladiella similis]